MNEFKTEEEAPIKILQIDPKVEKKLVARLKQIKMHRNRVNMEETLNKLRRAAEQENVNLMPFILQAVKEYATLGEICDTLREVFGEYKPPSIF
jgi:methylmalonyl-CoA mutase N-terminal domain/subunit